MSRKRRSKRRKMSTTEQVEVEQVKQEEGTSSAVTEQSSVQEPVAETAGDELLYQKRITELEAKVAELTDQYLRKAADFENFRKRINREKQEISDFANQNLLLDLIEIIDDFERALKAAETSPDFAQFYEGVALIERRFSSVLENKWGLKRFDSVGILFDPNRHEAIMSEQSEEVYEPTVAEDFQKGYTLKDRVIRNAKVKVLMPKNTEGES
ncbi:MAG: nucleotide exchange factor GrpE [Treponema sp.]|nr:nucleotide exchange factor GrpE [Treponema sp.]